MKYIALSIIMAFMINTCDSSAVASLQTINYKPTQCSEPWDEPTYTDKVSLNREERFKLFLVDKGISEIMEFKNTKDDKIYCSACNCPSNDNFSFKVSESDLAKLKTIEPFKTALSK